MTFEKDIAPSFAIDGRRKRLVGYIGQITDESGVVLHDHEYSTYGQAENALNAVVYDLLMDYAERGLVDPPADAPGDDCPDHGPYADDDCPKCCTTCDGEGRIPAYGYGDQAGGYAETCPDCDGRPHEVSSAELPPYTPLAPLFDDVARVIDMALGKSHGATSVVAELRRVRARLAAEQDTDTKQNQPTGWCYVCGSSAWTWDASGPLCPSHQAAVEEWAAA